MHIQFVQIKFAFLLAFEHVGLILIIGLFAGRIYDFPNGGFLGGSGSFPRDFFHNFTCQNQVLEPKGVVSPPPLAPLLICTQYSPGGATQTSAKTAQPFSAGLQC